MIQKLESAGLGFFIKATETQERIGMYNFSYKTFVLLFQSTVAT